MAVKMVKLGPKEMEGTIWDKKGKSNIVQILISHQQNTINSIQFSWASESDEDMDVYASDLYGEPHGLKFSTVTIKYPHEYLVSVRGEYEKGRLVSLEFCTNKTRHGPFGRTGVSSNNSFDDFNYEFGPSFCFGGFHGSVHDGCLHAIGVYVKPHEIIDGDSEICNFNLN